MQTYQSKRRNAHRAEGPRQESRPSRDEMLRMSGAGAPQPMSPALREKFEPGFNADFSNIRISRGHIPEQLGVQAVAQGTDILLDSSAGMDVLGHELAHVVQQAQGRVEGGFPVVENAALEREADVMGLRAASGLTAQTGGETMSIAPMSSASAPAQCKIGKDKDNDQEQAPASASSGHRAAPVHPEEALNIQANQQLAAMGSDRIEQVLSGQGSAADQAEFGRLMQILNGEAAKKGGGIHKKGELSQENIRMLYSGGAASKQFVIDRILGNIVNHVQQFHQAKHPNGYQLTRDAHRDYMADLQNDAIRTGRDGAISEYGMLGMVASEPAVPAMRQVVLKESAAAKKSVRGLKAGDDAYKDRVAASWDALRSRTAGLIQPHAQELRDLNGEFMTRLQTAMPEVFHDEETTRSFVGKSSFLRHYHPVLSASFSSDKNRDYSVKLVQGMLRWSNSMLDRGNAAVSPDVTALRDAIVPSWDEVQARAAAPAPDPYGGQTHGAAPTATSGPGWTKGTAADWLGAAAPAPDPYGGQTHGAAPTAASGPGWTKGTAADWLGAPASQSQAEKKKKWYQFWK